MWNGDEFIRQQEALYRRRVEAAAIHLKNEIRILISTPSRTVTFGTAKGGKRKTILGPRGSNRSKPGEPPHKDYGNLRNSIAYQMGDGATAKIGSPSKVALWLELGTKKMQPRPFIRVSLLNHREEIQNIIAAGKVSKITIT